MSISKSPQVDYSVVRKLHFTVDSALFTELGERLVGKPHIALAELVKNSYDADATHVQISIKGDELVVEDNGHGMTLDEFEKFWMRIGTPHKQRQGYSPLFGRRLTGSKGIGRLAVQFLARNIRITSVSSRASEAELRAVVDWNDAVVAGELTEATAEYSMNKRTSEFVGNKHGTRISLSQLNQEWDASALKELATEIWMLQPPFEDKTTVDEPRDSFRVELLSSNAAAVEEFDQQMAAVFKIWTARIKGRLTDKNVNDTDRLARVSVELDDGSRFRQEFPVRDCVLNVASWEIRVFNLKYRQPFGISVSEARDYFRKYGGVHVYDAGFHLPYYGPNQDWLGVEQDHAQREWKSKLLPPELLAPRGLNDLPTQARLFGVVKVDTGKELELIKDAGLDHLGRHLTIQLSRDRLVNNQAYGNLAYMVRWSLDYYANRYRERQLELEQSLPLNSKVSHGFSLLDDVLAHHKDEIPAMAYRALKQNIQQIEKVREVELERLEARAGLLGSLATVGISALAFQHEITRMYGELEEITDDMRSVAAADKSSGKALTEVANRIDKWVEQSRSMRGLFAHMLDVDNREQRRRFRAKALIEGVFERLSRLKRGTELRTVGVDDQFRLPEGTYAEWASLFQNVMINAVNAMLDTPTKDRIIAVRSEHSNKKSLIVLEDTGVGLPVEHGNEYFLPFVRGLSISNERQALGAGGTGLGLTIVKTIAEKLGCDVAFVKPSNGFSTAFMISWRR